MSRLSVIFSVVFVVFLASTISAEEMYSSENFPTWEEFRSSVIGIAKSRNEFYRAHRELIWKYVDQNWEELYFVHRGSPSEIGGNVRFVDGGVYMEFLSNLLLIKRAKALKQLSHRKRVDPSIVRPYIESIRVGFPRLAAKILVDIDVFKRDYDALNHIEHRYHNDSALQINDFGLILHRDEVHFLAMPRILDYLRIMSKVSFQSVRHDPRSIAAFFHFHPPSIENPINPPSDADLASTLSTGPEIVFVIQENGMDVYECIEGKSYLLRSFFAL